jgi:hypothetical protein
MSDTLIALLRLTRDGELLFDGEVQAGNVIDLVGGLRLEVEWIRAHAETEDAE